MKVLINPSDIGGDLTAPPSKSGMQRAVATALLADGSSEILNPSFSNDCIAAMKMAECLGAVVRREADRVVIEGSFNTGCKTLNCGESGLGARLFTAIAALGSNWINLEGTGSLLKRPFNMLSESLEQLGVEVKTNNGYLPLKIRGPLRSGVATVDGSVSSQFLTGLLTVLPLVNGTSRLMVSDLKSKPYIDLTISVMQKFGVQVENDKYEIFTVPGSQKYVPSKYTVEGDWSGTAFLLVLGAITDSIRVNNISLSSAQADKKIIEVLQAAGAGVICGTDNISVKRSSLKAFEVDISDCPDLAPPLASLAAFCEGKSVLYGTERLKIKESDRGKVLQREFTKLGVKIHNFGNRIEVFGPAVIREGSVDSYGDHRISMALSLLSLAGRKKVLINGAESVNKSYPEFFNDLENIGVNLEIIE